MNGNTDCQLPQMLQPLDEWITEIRQQRTLTPFKDHIKSSQDPPQEYHINTTELSFDSHLPTVTQQRINIPPVVYNDRTLKEFIQGEETCLNLLTRISHFYKIHTYHPPLQMYPMLQPL